MAMLYGALAMYRLGGGATAGYVLVSRAPSARAQRGTPNDGNLHGQLLDPADRTTTAGPAGRSPKLRLRCGRVLVAVRPPDAAGRSRYRLHPSQPGCGRPVDGPQLRRR